MIDITDELFKFLLHVTSPYVPIICFVRAFGLFRSLFFDEVKVDESKK